MGFHDRPHGFQVDPAVIVNDLVPHPGDETPRNVGITGPEFFGQPLRRLANDFEVAEHGIRRPSVAQVGLFPFHDEALDGKDAVEDVRDEYAVAVTQTGTASERTRSRRSGWRPRSETT